jgi:hypothetical protein
VGSAALGLNQLRRRITAIGRATISRIWKRLTLDSFQGGINYMPSASMIVRKRRRTLYAQ